MLTNEVKATIADALDYYLKCEAKLEFVNGAYKFEPDAFYRRISAAHAALAALEEPPMSEWQRSSGFIYRYPNGGGLAYADPDGQGRAQLRCLVDCDGDTKETIIILPDHLRIFERIQKQEPT